MVDLPALTEVLNEEVDAESEFRILMKKLFFKDAQLRGYQFESNSELRHKGIDGVVERKYPDVNGPVVFQFKWLKRPINEGISAQQIKSSFEKILHSGVTFRTYILVSPEDLSSKEIGWLSEYLSQYKIEIFHYGNTIIQGLLKGYLALRKYYYGKYLNLPRDYGSLVGRYKHSVFEEVRHLEFIGLPTGQYQKQNVLKKTELKKVYIPIDFTRKQNDPKTLQLSEITKRTSRFVILGDPGSGKSTLAKYLALVYSKKTPLEEGQGIKGKVPLIVSIRDYINWSQQKPEQVGFIDYLKNVADNTFNFHDIDIDFFIALLELGKAVILFDGLDEITSESAREKIARSIESFSELYLHCHIWVTSRIVGYSIDVKLNPGTFDHYYLAPVSSRQANDFIEKWYTIQIPRNNTHRTNRINSLKNAIAKNPGVQRLKANPLLLTMMTLVHQFEGTLPDDRAKLYEKCIELLLKSWQEKKYSTLGQKNPLEVRGLRYDEQLRLLAATAFYIQNKNQNKSDEDTRGLIEEKELTEVLFNARYDEKRLSEETAREDIRIFLDYIRSRAGLFVEKGRNEKKENVFSFVHLSFLEYLCAYQMAEDKSKSQAGHIEGLLNYLGKSPWEEIILLSLYLFSKSTSATSFIDAFCESVFKKLTVDENSNAWLLLGRALRDNIDFASEDVERIIEELLKLWYDGAKDNYTAISILTEIHNFSERGKGALKTALIGLMKHLPAEEAFLLSYLYDELYEGDPKILEIIDSNKDKLRLLPYLPVFKENKHLIAYVQENLGVSQWVMYYNSARDITVEALDRILGNRLNGSELKGFVISIWSKIVLTFQERNPFIEKNKGDIKKGVWFKIINFDFQYAKIDYPLTLFRYYVNTTEMVVFSKISNKVFKSLDRSNSIRFNDKYFYMWINKVLLRSFSALEEDSLQGNSFHRREEMDENKKIESFSQNFSRYLHDYLGRYFAQDLSEYFDRYLKRDFMRYFDRDLNPDFSRYLTQNINRDLSQDFSRGFSFDFSRDLSRYFCRDLSRYFSRDFSRELSEYLARYLSRYRNQDFKNLISEHFEKKYNQNLDWEKLTQRKYEMIYDLFIDEFNQENFVFIEQFFLFLYNYLFYHTIKVTIESFDFKSQSFSGRAIKDVSDSNISLKTPFLIPFTFNFILTGALNHYIINLLANLKSRLFSEKVNVDETILLDAVNDYINENPFMCYVLNYSWSFYSKDFYQLYQQGDESVSMRLAAFIISAAKVSLVAGVRCEGEAWNEILKEAEKSSDPFVQISLTLYKLCNFEEREKNSELLNEQLQTFKKDYPEYYKLIGFNS